MLRGSFMEQIQSFGDTPAPQTDVRELEAAEDQVQQEEREQIQEENEHLEDERQEAEETAPASDIEDEVPEDEDTETLRLMSPEQRLMYRFYPQLEYGTPSGIDNKPVGCPGCSDAADAAIIDAEITPSDGSGEDEGGTTGGDELGGEPETDLSEDITMFLQSLNNFERAVDYRVGNESLVEALISVGKFLSDVFIRVTKYARRTWKYVRDKHLLTYNRLTLAQKFWTFKLKNNLDKVDPERISTYEIEAFPYDVWVEACKSALSAFDMTLNAERIVFDSAAVDTTTAMRSFADRLANLGVTINISKNRLELDDLLDKRVHASILELGYGKSHIPNLLRYFSEISDRVKPGANGQQAKAELIVSKLLKEVTNKASQLSAAVDSGDLTKNSAEYQLQMQRLMSYTVRLDFILSLQRYSALIFNRLTTDAQRVFSKYEDSMSWKAIV